MSSRFLSPLTRKVFAIGAIAVLLVILIARVQYLVEERSGMRAQAAARVAAGWGGPQTLGAPMLAIPFETDQRSGERTVRVRHVFYTLAREATVGAELRPDLRRVGIYSVPVYLTSVTLAGSFDSRALEGLEAPDRTIDWAHARIIVPVADVRGIRDVRAARWRGRDLRLEPDGYDSLKGIGASVPVEALRAGTSVDFRVELELAGSEGLRLLPLAERTSAEMRSSWPHPNFSSGAYLPLGHSIDSRGFEARWNVLELNRGFPQSWIDTAVTGTDLLAAGFGTDLYQPVDTYQRNTRATKYAILFIAITLMSVFLWEQVARLRLHAMQYLLVGLALSVFYLLLLALSEHLSFLLAYVVSATALVALVGTYMAGVVRRRSAGVVSGAVLALVYGMLYLLVLSEEYALLLGAVLVFAVLAVIMLVTRGMDWHAVGAREEGAPARMPPD